MKTATDLKPRPAMAIRIRFEDHGQDFLEWDLDESGRVLACRPFQEWMWRRGVVLNVTDLRKGAIVIYRMHGITSAGQVKYPLQTVRRIRLTGPAKDES